MQETAQTRVCTPRTSADFPELTQAGGGRGPLVTHSSGNHAQALALAAKQAGMVAHIVMPSNAPSVKVDAVREYGANILRCEPTLADRRRTADELLAANPGAVLIPPYDHPDVISGQGTLALEFLDQVNPSDHGVCQRASEIVSTQMSTDAQRARRAYPTSLFPSVGSTLPPKSAKMRRNP